MRFSSISDKGMRLAGREWIDGEAPFRCISAEFCSHFPPAIPCVRVRPPVRRPAAAGKTADDDATRGSGEGGALPASGNGRASKNDIRGQQNATQEIKMANDSTRFASRFRRRRLYANLIVAPKFCISFSLLLTLFSPRISATT